MGEVYNDLPCTIEDVVGLIGIQVIRNTNTQMHCRCPFCNDRKAHLIICWIIIVFSLTFLQQQKTDKKLSQVSKRLLLCCFSFLVFFYFPHRNMFQNAEPLKIDLTYNEETASLKGILSKERSNTILETCNHLYISRSVLKTLFDRSNGAIAYIYFSGRYDNRAKNYIAVKSSNNPPIIKKNGIAYHIWTPVNFLTLLQKLE